VTDTPTIRPERPGDDAAIAAVLRAAFGGGWEADLVGRLRAAGALAPSLVAEDGDGHGHGQGHRQGHGHGHGTIVGHLAFSPLPVVTATGTVAAVALAPLAVHPARQRRGIGTLLVRDGLARLRKAGSPLVVVLGDPAYYGRFGFRADAAAGLRCPFAGPALQALAFDPGASALTGEATYHPAFFAA
jgi:putative acetyltransferase